MFIVYNLHLLNQLDSLTINHHVFSPVDKPLKVAAAAGSSQASVEVKLVTIISGLSLVTPLYYPQQSRQTEPNTPHNQQRAVIEILTKECNFYILGSE